MVRQLVAVSLVVSIWAHLFCLSASLPVEYFSGIPLAQWVMCNTPSAIDFSFNCAAVLKLWFGCGPRTMDGVVFVNNGVNCIHLYNRCSTLIMLNSYSEYEALGQHNPFTFRNLEPGEPNP